MSGKKLILIHLDCARSTITYLIYKLSPCKLGTYAKVTKSNQVICFLTIISIINFAVLCYLQPTIKNYFATKSIKTRKKKLS